MNAPRTFPQGFLEPQPGHCQILLVRHGQSAALTEGQLFDLKDGQGDPPLSERGRWQATQLRDRLADHPIEAIWVSTLQRTSQTAAPLAARLGLQPHVDADLREVHLGDWEGGLFRIKIADGHPTALKMIETREWGHIPGAETNEQLRTRTVAAVGRIAAAHRGQMVVVVCHGGVITQLAAHALGGESAALHGVRNASITHLYVNAADPGDQWIMRTFNDASHVGPLNHDLDPD